MDFIMIGAFLNEENYIYVTVFEEYGLLPNFT